MPLLTGNLFVNVQRSKDPYFPSDSRLRDNWADAVSPFWFENRKDYNKNYLSEQSIQVASQYPQFEYFEHVVHKESKYFQP